MSRRITIVVLLLSMHTFGCSSLRRGGGSPASPRLAVPAEPAMGDNVVVSASGLTPGSQYDFTLRDTAGTYVSLLRLTADRSGSIGPHVLLYQSGVVGCSKGADQHLRQPHRYRTFEEAEERLANMTFQVELRGVNNGSVAKQSLRMRPSGSPRAYFSTDSGCLMNASDGSEDIFVTARDLLPGTVADVFVVAHQARWEIGDPIVDIRNTGRAQTAALEGERTTMTIPLWRRGQLAPGSYDVIIRPYQTGSDRAVTPFLDYRDIVGSNGAVGIVVYDDHASHLVEQIAGREIHTYPWFEHQDAFAIGTDVYGALDPKRKPSTHPGTYAAWYVVDHQPSWSSGDALTDVSGAVEITPIQPGCINGTWTLLWPTATSPFITPAAPTRPYDVVIDFGNLSSSSGTFMSDNAYTEGMDFVDLYGAVGFYLVSDPRTAGALPVGDVEVPASGSGCDTDLDGITITWTDPVFYPAQTFPVAIGDDDMGGEDGRCGGSPTLVDMRARIWYPKDASSSAVAGGGPFPVVVFYHGQQIWSIPGYHGYEYLGMLLASHGFVVYSIDARSLLNATIASRGEHIRAHMRKLVTMNAGGSGSIFSGQLDLAKVAIAGHSRGGDAVVAAYEWQRVQPDAGYAFKAVIAIAPVQFFDDWSPPEPTFRPHLRDAAYMILHGSKDGDVADFQGLRTYDRSADVQLPGQTPKSMIFVKDANHNFFNTVWETLEGDDYGGGGILTGAAQRDTATVYIHSAVQAWLRNRDEYVHFLDGTVPYPGTATVALDYQRAAADAIIVDSHEVISSATHDALTNSAGGAVTTSGLGDYTERQLHKNVASPWASYPGETWGGSLSWDAPTDIYSTEVTSAIRTALDPAVMTHLAFRVGQVYRSSMSPNPAGLDQNFLVRLHDTDGDVSPWVRVQDFAHVFPPWDNLAWGGVKTVMSAVRIPLQVFTTNTSSLVDLTKLDRIDLGFASVVTGEIAFDDIRFTK